MPSLGGMVDVIEAEANDLAGILDRQPEAHAGERPSGIGTGAARSLAGRGEGGVARPDHAEQVARQVGRGARQIDHGLALQDAEPCLAAIVERHQPHGRLLAWNKARRRPDLRRDPNWRERGN